MTHPRHDLPFTYTRRQFWRALLQEMFVTRGTLQGKPGGRLSELGSLPDDRLAQITPIINPECEIFVDQNHVWSRHKKTGATTKLFPMERENLAAFNLFNGSYTLGQVAQSVSQELGWDAAQASAHVRELFLLLVSHMVCVPRDPPEI